jgi:hypothetical protein
VSWPEGRSSQACKGAHTKALRAASTHKVSRQPQCSTKAAVKGMNTVLASPPKNVMVMMARRYALP